jgi:cobalt/nickel transport system ATP-binding protein
MSHHQPILDAHGLSFRYEDGTEALQGVDLMVHRGERVALLGANGSGKTTLLLRLCGVLQGPGTVEVCGLELSSENLRTIRRKIGFLFQDPDDQLFLPTVVEDVAFGPLQQGCDAAEARRRAMAALERVGLSDAASRSPHRLSAGQRQRAALAGVLAGEPEIIVLDEPTNHLDPPSRRSLVELLRGLPQSLLVVTHDVGFAAQLAQRAVFFDHGRIIADGPLETIAQRFQWGTASGC